MDELLKAILFLVLLFVFVGAGAYFTLKKSSNAVLSSKYILNKFEPDNTAPKLTEMIEFHKKHENLSKYNVE